MPLAYYLDEPYTPLAALVKAGYTPVFAKLNGDTPSTDASSNDAKFFGGDDAERMEALKFVDSLQELRHPLRLSFIVSHRNGLVGMGTQHQCDSLVKRAQERLDYFAAEAGDPAWNYESVLISLSNAQISTSHPGNRRRVPSGRTSN